MGITDAVITEVAPYRYRFADKNGIVENEICPIHVGYSDAQPVPDPSEADDWKWVDWSEFLRDTGKNGGLYSPWCIEEARIIDTLGIIRK
jgi:isopentenyl-diphosphate delta-isomerase